MANDTRLILIYQRVEPYLYGAVSVVGPEAAAKGGTIPLQWSYPFVVSKYLDGREITYGSIAHLIDEVAKPIFRRNQRIRVLAESLPEKTQASLRVRRTENALIHESPSSELPNWFMQEQEDLTKEALLMSGLHLRTLLEMLSGRRNKSVLLYDYEGNANGTVTLNTLFHMLMHHRYCVISGEYVHDIFSDRGQLESPRIFGAKVKSAELFNLMLTYLSEITINDFVGVLRGSLRKLSVESQAREIMFAVQNVHSLAEIIGDRISDPRFPQMQKLLFREFTADEKRNVEAAKTQSETISLVRHFTKPAFQIDSAVQTHRIEMSMKINDKPETFKFDQDEFLGVLTDTFGRDPLVSRDQLLKRYDTADA